MSRTDLPGYCPVNAFSLLKSCSSDTWLHYRFHFNNEEVITRRVLTSMVNHDVGIDTTSIQVEVSHICR